MDYRLGDLTFDDQQHILRRGDQEIALRPKATDVLEMLAANARRVVSKDDLLQRVWPDVTVNEEGLTQCIHEIRNALGAGNAHLLRTVRGRGYMLDAETGPASWRLPALWRRRRGWPAILILSASGLAAVVLAAAFWVRTPAVSAPELNPILSLPLLQTGTTILGEPIVYPVGVPTVSAAIYTFDAGAESTWHVNEAPTFIYVLEGRLEIEYDDGRIFEAGAGTAFIEGVGRPHVGRSTARMPSRYLVVDLGAEGLILRPPAQPPATRRTPGPDG